MVKPDEGREYSDSKFKVSLFWPKSEWKQLGEELESKVLEVAYEAYGIKPLKPRSFKHPFRDGDERDNPGVFQDSMYITAKTGFKPEVIGPDKKELSESEVSMLKSGDYARAVLDIYTYTQKGGGLTLGLRTLQFARVGSAIGAGQALGSSMLDELEVELEDIEEEDIKVGKQSVSEAFDDAVSEGEETEDAEDDDEEEEDNSLSQFAA